MTCKSFAVEFLGSLMYTIIPPAETDMLTSSFPVCFPLIYLSCLTALAVLHSTSKYCYQKGVERGQPYLVSIFMGIV